MTDNNQNNNIQKEAPKGPGGPSGQGGQGGPPMVFAMPMMKDWVPKAVRPWIYVLQVFCIQFSGGMYLGSLESIRGTTNFMMEDVMFLLYAGLAGMAIYFPLVFRMKFRFTNQQLLCTSAIIIAICNLITMHCTFMPLLMIICFISGMAKLQGTFENMSIIQLWITPKRDFGVFFPALHIVLLTAIEGGGFVAAWFTYQYCWQMMHIFVVGLMCVVLTIQLVFCQPFCPMPHRLSLKGIDFTSGALISIFMLTVSYIMVYGDHEMWFDSETIRLLTGTSIILLGLILLRLRSVEHPYIDLHIFTVKNILPIYFLVFLAELLLGCEHTLESILYSSVIGLAEHTKEEQMLWSIPGIYVGLFITWRWLAKLRWKIWKLLAIGFACVTVYAILMYTHIDVNINIEQYRIAIMFRGAAYAILSATLMWALNETLRDVTSFFMGLCVFNIIHMYLAGASGYGFYTTIFNHFMNDDMSRYGEWLSLTNLDMAHFNFGEYMSGYSRSMMTVAIKQVYGIVIWGAGFAAFAFLLLDIPAVRTNVRMETWSAYGKKMLRKLRRRRGIK